MGIILICNFFSFIFWIIIIVNILCLRSSSTVPDLSHLLPILPAQCWFWVRTLKPRLRGGRFLVCSPSHSNPLTNLDIIASSLFSWHFTQTSGSEIDWKSLIGQQFGYGGWSEGGRLSWPCVLKVLLIKLMGIFRQFQWEGGRGERSRVVFVCDRPH